MMPQPPRSRYLTHAYPMYRGCDVMELLWLGVTIVVSLVLVCVLFGSGDRLVAMVGEVP